MGPCGSHRERSIACTFVSIPCHCQFDVVEMSSGSNMLVRVPSLNHRENLASMNIVVMTQFIV